MKRFYYYGLRWQAIAGFYETGLWAVDSDNEHAACEDAKKLHSEVSGAILRDKRVVDDYFRWYGECKETSTGKEIKSQPIITHFLSPGFQDWMKKLPDELHIGRKVKVVKGTLRGREGVVTDHWQNLDDCSGGYGNHLYQLEGDIEKYGCRNNSCAINADYCEFVD